MVLALFGVGVAATTTAVVGCVVGVGVVGIGVFGFVDACEVVSAGSAVCMGVTAAWMA